MVSLCAMFSKEISSNILLLLKTQTIDESIKALGILLSSLGYGDRSMFYLHLSSDLKCLIPYSIGKSIEKIDVEFDVVDFSHPFSHVIQSRENKMLSYQSLIIWGHDGFQQLVALANWDNLKQYMIIPIISDSSQLTAMLFLEKLENEQCVSMDTFQWIIEVFCFQLNTLKQSQIMMNDKKQLMNNLKDLTDSEKKKQCFQLIKSHIIGKSQAMLDLFQHMSRISYTPLSILINGETGVGKDLVARTIHHASDHKSGPFVPVNCGAIPAHLFESEFFGHTKGAFTGAETDREGLISLANGGTLFLDEIGDMPLEIQQKFLRVLETKKYRPLGSDEEKTSDFRIISATHVDLNGAIECKTFRSDLYYRISQYIIKVPSLSERIDDINALVEYFIQEFNHNNQKQIKGMRQSALSVLQSADYSGNVRELKSIILACCSLTDSDWITMDTVWQYFKTINKEITQIHLVNDETTELDNKEFLLRLLQDKGGLNQSIVFLEKKLLTISLTQHDFNRKQTADFLQIPLRTLSHKCQAYGLCKNNNEP